VTVQLPPQPEQLTISDETETFAEFMQRTREEALRELGLEPDEREGEAA
jgi:hypothetical protein